MKYYLLLFCLGISFPSFSQEDLKYQKPSASILSLTDYQSTPRISMDTKKEYMLFQYRNTYKTLDDLNQPELRLGGLRINPITSISASTSYLNNLQLRKVKDVNSEPIQVAGLPSNPRITFVQWSLDDKKIAFTNTSNTGVELWVIDVATAQASKVVDKLNANVGLPYNWLPDNEHLLIRRIPSNRKELLDPKKDLPNGPSVSITDGKASQNRTYPDLLKNNADEVNFETLVNAELDIVDLHGGIKLFKPADLFIGQSYSPDGNYVMLTTIQKPFSYIVPFSRFPMKTFVYKSSGELVKQVNEVPLTEIMPKGFAAVRKGKRSMNWRADKPSTLYFVEALDEGDPAKKVEFRDALFVWNAPFNTEPQTIVKTIQRFAGLTWGNEHTAIVSDSWYDTRNEKTYLIDPAKENTQPKIIFDRNSQDIYSDPGSFETRENEYGQYVLAIEKNTMILLGEGFTPKGQFPFIDEFDITTAKNKRVYTSSYTDKKESILSIEDYKNGVSLIQLESKSEFPNYYFRNYKQKEKMTPITTFKNPFAVLNDIHKEVIKYKRADGVELSGTLYLPKGYDKSKKYPMLIWAYPEEFKDKSSAGQSNKNPNEFTFPNYGSFVYWVMKGYVVLDDASFPIIGEGRKEPNDNFMEQLVANGKAAIDAVDQLGYIDRTKVAVGGHSYGAFMTANLLTHSDLFACGIARSGAYNRTLTPFGFQSEQRNYWDIPEIYNGMSPFMNASKMKKPILLIHGDADNNPGTFTLQTERYFQALKGLGANARMVLLPKEAHGYAAKENILHVLWEQEQFLDKYLKP